MRLSLPISVVLHSALLLSAALALPDPEEFDVSEPIPIPVDIMTVSEFNELRAQEEQAVETEQPAAAPVEEPAVEPPPPIPTVEAERTAIVEPEPEPVPPEPEPEVVPEPEPAPVVEPAPEPEPEPAPEQEASYPLPVQKPTPPRRTQPEPQQEQFDLDRIAALLDKSVEENQAPREAPEQPGSPTQGEQVTSGSAAQLSQSALQYLARQIDPCWSRPIGAMGAESLVVVVQFSLNQNGSVSGVPEIVNSGSSTQFVAAAEAVRRAVLRCQPFNLPPEFFPIDQFDVWSEVRLTADPSRGMGG